MLIEIRGAVRDVGILSFDKAVERFGVVDLQARKKHYFFIRVFAV
jgi:hypothetical protein